MSSVTRQRNPRGEGARLRDPLIEATVALIDELGDASKVSVRAITRRAGVSPTALYLHFPDRDAAVEAAVDAGFEAFNAAVLEAAATATEPRERLRAMGLAYLAFAERQPQLYSVLFSARRTYEGSAEVNRSAGFDGLVALVIAALGSEEAANDIAVAVWAALHGYATLCPGGSPGAFPPHEAFIDRLLDAYF